MTVQLHLTSHFFTYLPEEKPVEIDLHQRILEIVLYSFQCLKITLFSLGYASFKAIKSIPKSFCFEVIKPTIETISPYSRKMDYFIFILFLSIWSVKLCVFILMDTYRSVKEQLDSLEKRIEKLSHFADKLIDLRHFELKEETVDISEIPNDTNIDLLLTFFDELNLYHGRGSLQQFIDHVKTRTPFIGTPPVHDQDRLEAFYRQIEDRVRYCLHQINCTKDDNLKFSRKKQMVETLAEAGNYCGARYMGETVQLYQMFRGSFENPQESFEEAVFDLLARKRQAIADDQIARLGQDVHFYTRYMQQFGKLLSLPTAQGVDEYLSRSFNTEECLRDFFRKYTPASITDTIQKELQNSKPLQNKLIAWLSEQDICSTKNQENELLQKVQNIISDKKTSEEVLTKKASELRELLPGVPKESLLRLIRHEANEADVVAQFENVEKRSEFFSELGLENIEQTGPSKALVDFICLSLKIFNRESFLQKLSSHRESSALRL